MTTGASALLASVSVVVAALAAPVTSTGAPPSKAIHASGPAAAFFESKVRPVLAARCYSCHSASSQPVQGGLRVDSREALLRGGVRGPALVPGEPNHSSLIQAIGYGDKGLRMPPDRKLPPAEVAALTAWVKNGAEWPAGGGQGSGAGGQGAEGTRQKAAGRGGAHWAWRAPVAGELPRVKDAAWAKNPIDRFILAGLEAKGLSPAPPADRRTLIRRATYDLTGLPPTTEEIAAFLADRSPTAWEKVVDRLLASPAYGERWGRHWLDVARYADSNGLDENLVFRNAWRYRDYVIRAFNQDKPIDRFIQEQIAGDLLPPSADETANLDRTIATGYLSLGGKMLAEDDPVKQEEDIIDEQVDTLGKTYMGLTLGCARCHDHKFDPFPQTDYYALAGIFKSTKTMESFRVVAEWQEVPLVSVAERDRLAEVGGQIAAKRAEMEKLRRNAAEARLAEANGKSSAYLQVARELAAAPTVSLKPVIPSPDGTAPAGAQVLEAEDFVRGNVLKDRDNYGRGIGVLVNAGQYPNFTEYDVSVPADAPYQLDLRYASGDPRPIRILVNGAQVASHAAGEVTGGFFPNAQRWFAEGVFRLRAGSNRIRLERDSYFPHIDKLLLVSRAGQPYSRSLEQAASEAGLVPELLEQAVEYARKPTTPKLVLRLPDDPTHLLPAPVQAELARLDSAVKGLEKEKTAAPRAMAVSEGKPTDMKVHIRGSYLTLGKDCPRAFPAILSTGSTGIPAGHSGRLELAQWMTRPDHPLTARVFVNRVWRWHFGRGIVPSTDNFGTLGDRPMNQPLLDWLATVFAGAASSEAKYGSGGVAGYGSGSEPGLGVRVRFGVRGGTDPSYDATARKSANLTPPKVGGLGGRPASAAVNGLMSKRVHGKSGTLTHLPIASLTSGNAGLGWSLKKLHRLIILSNTYQMSSHSGQWSVAGGSDRTGKRSNGSLNPQSEIRNPQSIDPENRLLSHMGRRRLEAEEIRDAILAVSGRLDRTMGGSLLTFKDREYVTSTANADPVNYRSQRRSVYLPVIRSALYELYTAFDFGDPTVMNGDRPTTTVAPQALFVMNSPLVLESTRTMAAALLSRRDLDDTGRVRATYEACYGRPPSMTEVRRALELMTKVDAALAGTEPDAAKRRRRAWQSFCKAVIGANEFIYIE